MKLVKLTNISKKRLTFPVRGADGTMLVLDPKESKNVFPATVQHPAVSRYIGQGLEVEGYSAAAPKQKESEPSKAPTPPPAPPAAPTPKDESGKEESGDEPKEPADEPAGEKKEDIRSLYVSSAPGVDEANIDVVLDKFPTIEALSKASKPELLELGIEKPHILIKWAKEHN